jgi:hypothetical protein
MLLKLWKKKSNEFLKKKSNEVTMQQGRIPQEFL